MPWGLRPDIIWSTYLWCRTQKLCLNGHHESFPQEGTSGRWATWSRLSASGISMPQNTGPSTAHLWWYQHRGREKDTSRIGLSRGRLDFYCLWPLLPRMVASYSWRWLVPGAVCSTVEIMGLLEGWKLENLNGTHFRFDIVWIQKS